MERLKEPFSNAIGTRVFVQGLRELNNIPSSRVRVTPNEDYEYQEKRQNVNFEHNEYNEKFNIEECA